jgi:osmoprotectant transport system ATP-binding protein
VGEPRLVIELTHVGKRFPDGTVAVEDLTLTMETGTISVLVGTSGCGKTTTLRMINRMLEPTSGTIEIDGRDVMTIPAHELRRGIGYVIQQGGLFPHRTVVDNVATVPYLLGWDKKRARQRSNELLELVGLDRRLAGRYPAQLSGGQQQRVGVARALAADPPVLLMDEPFGAVDPIVRAQLQQEFLRLQRELQKTVVFVTHDIDEAVLLGNRIAVLKTGGDLQQYAPPEEMLARPANEFVAGFLGEDRGLKRLALVPADQVPYEPLLSLNGDWELALDAAGRPLGWRPRNTAAHAPPTPLDPVGPRASARSLLDAALASPAGVAVRVDDDGRAIGVVTIDELSQQLAFASNGATPNGPQADDG